MDVTETQLPHYSPTATLPPTYDSLNHQIPSTTTATPQPRRDILVQARIRRTATELRKIKGQHPSRAIEAWCVEFEQAIRGESNYAPNRDWNYYYLPNYEQIEITLENILEKKEEGVFFQAQANVDAEHLKIAKKNSVKALFREMSLPSEEELNLDQYKTQVKNFKTAIDPRGRCDVLDEVIATKWLKAFDAYIKSPTLFPDNWNFKHEANFTKISQVFQKLSVPYCDLLNHSHRVVKPEFHIDALAKKMKLEVAPPGFGKNTSKRVRRRTSSSCMVMSLGERRIGRRQAAMRGIDTLGDAQDGGLLLA
ncbi:hypothetical protein JCM5353_004383 [Sporobolomyces roseus]